jgi:hypothetical protein
VGPGARRIKHPIQLASLGYTRNESRCSGGVTSTVDWRVLNIPEVGPSARKSKHPIRLASPGYTRGRSRCPGELNIQCRFVSPGYTRGRSRYPGGVRISCCLLTPLVCFISKSSKRSKLHSRSDCQELSKILV